VAAGATRVDRRFLEHLSNVLGETPYREWQADTANTEDYQVTMYLTALHHGVLMISTSRNDEMLRPKHTQYAVLSSARFILLVNDSARDVTFETMS